MNHDKPSSPTPAANDERTALATLKALLVGPEQQSIERLENELHSPKVQTERVAETLADSLHKAYRDNPAQLSTALDRPVAECLQGSVQRDPGFFADVLYPVMGPAIRRSIAQTMKGLVQQINQTLEHSLTLKGLKWRMEAARSGVPFAEIVLRNTLRYRVEEAFLIQSGSGLLIQHLSEEHAVQRDADAVSGMLTAIRDFARDTLEGKSGCDARLETIDAGDHTLWLVHGPKAYLACAIRGVPPVDLRDDLTRVLEAIHRQYADLLDAFDGDPAQAGPLRPLLEPCLQTEVAKPGGRGFPWPLAIVLLLAIGALGWWANSAWQSRSLANAEHARQLAGVEQLAALPGTVLTDWQITDGRLQLRGLHDPLTTKPTTALAKAGLIPAEYQLSFQPFQSSDPVAALARARQRLAPPDSVELTLDEQGTLRADGVASTSWQQRAEILATTVPGIERFDQRGVEDVDARLRRTLNQRLNPPKSVNVTVDDAVATLDGKAPLAWIRTLPAEGATIAGLKALRHDTLQSLEEIRLRDLWRMIEQVQIHFVTGTELDAAERERIATLAGLVNEAREHAQALGWPLRLQIIGHTDGTGTPEQNHFIARQRAATVAQRLNDTAFDMPEISLLAATKPPPRLARDAELRRVDFRLLDLGSMTTEGTTEAVSGR